MSQFTSGFWDLYISVVTIVSIVACGVFLKLHSVRRAPGTTSETTGHTWDEDLGEYNNPLPRWWMWLFYITIVFSLAYLYFYPGLGSYPGSLGWSQVKQLEDEVAEANQQYGPIYERYAKLDLRQVASEPAALAIGQKLFLNHCSQCHGSDAGGGKGFPNLRDRDWLYGGEPETIKTSITDGRNGVMPALGPSLGEEGARNVAHFVRSLSGLPHDASKAQLGKVTFDTVCAACHGPQGKGNQQVGAPNLTDNIWLYGNAEQDIMGTVIKGRGAQLVAGQSAMPAHKGLLSEAKIHLLAGYVYSLSNPAPRSGGAPPSK